MLTPFGRRLEMILQNPDILEGPSLLQFEAFYNGYAFVAPGIRWLAPALDAHFQVPASSLRAWHYQYMKLGHREGLRQVLMAALDLVAESDARAREGAIDPPPSPVDFVSVVGEALRLGRAPMYLGEMSMDWLYNFSLGVLASEEDYHPEVAGQRRARLARFEQWLQAAYKVPGGAWQRILRVYGGPGAEGVYLFFSRWGEFMAEPEGDA